MFNLKMLLQIEEEKTSIRSHFSCILLEGPGSFEPSFDGKQREDIIKVEATCQVASTFISEHPCGD